MKVLLDANVYISYLLAPSGHLRVVKVVEACLTDPDIELVVPEELVAELQASVRNKVYLRTHIAPIDLTMDAVAIRLGFWDWGQGLSYDYYGSNVWNT